MRALGLAKIEVLKARNSGVLEAQEVYARCQLEAQMHRKHSKYYGYAFSCCARSTPDESRNLRIRQPHRSLAASVRLPGSEIGRVVAEHRTRFIVATKSGEVDAETKGSLRFSLTAREDLPAVGDWIALDRTDASSALIHGILRDPP